MAQLDIISEIISPKKIKSSQDFGKPLKVKESLRNSTKYSIQDTAFSLSRGAFMCIPINFCPNLIILLVTNSNILKEIMVIFHSTRIKCGIIQNKNILVH